MPDKEGSDDEKKSTKSVINKKQKQMMGEEGYDIARDMGKVRPSEDKKDATTLRKPPSKEMKKTQKVNKGPSAFERVKKKYKGQIMDVGKKKANEELDLTQVAEALGGYIVEAPLKSLTGDPEEIEKRIKKGAAEVTGQRKERGAKALAKAAGIKLATQGPEQAAATQAFKDMRMSGDKKFSDLTPDTKTGMRATAAGKGRAEPEDEMMASSGGKKKGEFKAPTLSPTSGGRKVSKRFGPPGPESAARKAADDVRKKDMMKSGRIGGRNRKFNPRGDAIKALTNLSKESELEGKRKDYLDPKTNKASPEGVKKYITKARQMRSGSNVPVDQETTDNIAKIAGKEYEDKINQKYGGRRAGKRKSTATPPAFATRTGESGGPLPVSMRNRRVPKTSSLSTPVTTTPTFKGFQDRVKEVTPEIVTDTEYTQQTIPGMGSTPVKSGRTVDTVKRGFKSDPKYIKPPKNYDPDQLELDFNQKPEKPSFADFEKRRFKAPDIPKTKTALQDPPKKPSTDTETQTQTDSGTGGKGGGRIIKKKFGPGGPNKPFTPIKSAREFARKDPVAALGAYDLGKGILGKIMKTRLPSLQAKSGFRSAKGGGGL